MGKIISQHVEQAINQITSGLWLTSGGLLALYIAKHFFAFSI